MVELNTVIFDLLYLLAAILFIMGIKKMSHPRSAVFGNLLGVVGMLIAAGVSVAIILENETVQTNMTLPLGTIIGAIFIGTFFGTMLATQVQMTEMPQLVAIFNGVGGLASVLVAAASLLSAKEDALHVEVLIAGGISGLIGAVTFVGSGIAAVLVVMAPPAGPSGAPAGGAPAGAEGISSPPVARPSAAAAAGQS